MSLSLARQSKFCGEDMVTIRMPVVQDDGVIRQKYLLDLPKDRYIRHYKGRFVKRNSVLSKVPIFGTLFKRDDEDYYMWVEIEFKDENDCRELLKHPDVVVVS